MKRISFWVLSTISALVLLFGYHTSTAGTLGTSTNAVSPIVNSGGTGSHGGSSGTSGGGPDPGGSTGSGSNGATANSTQTVTGGVAMTQWGPVQVQLTVTGGQITKVAVLQYPNGNGMDYRINSYALPRLIQETQQAQSANISMISGATITSSGYIQSLQSAIDQAGL